jgi:membrane peptidoglycan carboxypeptidase
MKSKNLVSVRVMQAITPQYAQDYITRFGFDPQASPAYLTMALGAGNVTPLQMLGAYAIFANGAFASCLTTSSAWRIAAATCWCRLSRRPPTAARSGSSIRATRSS